MALPSALPISLSQVSVELGRASNAAVSMLEPAALRLTGRSAGPVSMNNFANCMKFQLTAAYDLGNTGFDAFRGLGAINQANYRGVPIYLVIDNQGTKLVLQLQSTSTPQNFFTGLWINGVQYLSIAASTYVVSTSLTQWAWNTNPGLVDGGVYDVYIG